MPLKPRARCTQPGCTNKAVRRGRCEQHQDTWTRASQHTQLIDQHRWSQIRAIVLRRDHNRCVKCGKPGNEVDHIREVADNGALYDPNNAQTLCHQCHLRKSIDMERARRAREKARHEDPHAITMNIWDKHVQGR